MLCLAVLTAALLSPLPAIAQVYIGAYVGPVFPHDSEVTITDEFRLAVFTEAQNEGSNISTISIPISDFEFTTRPLVGGRIGLWLSDLNLPFLGLEAEVYGGSANIDDQTVAMRFIQTVDGVPSDNTAVFNITEIDLNMVTVGLNVLARWPKGRIQPYGGAGVGLVYAQVDNFRMPSRVTVISGGSTQELTGSEFASQFNVLGDDVENLFVRSSDFVAGLQLMGGVRAFILENVALFAEYKYLTTELEFRDFEMDYDASHIFGGFEFYFGPGLEKKKQ